MFNWRKPIIYASFAISGYPVFQKFKYIKSIENESTEKILQLQNQKLELLLRHAYQNVPYYKRILANTNVIRTGKVDLDNFTKIPPLTKQTIRNQKGNIYSSDYEKRSWYRNTSGGSTGEPVEFIQDREYKAWGLSL